MIQGKYIKMEKSNPAKETIWQAERNSCASIKYLCPQYTLPENNLTKRIKRLGTIYQVYLLLKNIKYTTGEFILIYSGCKKDITKPINPINITINQIGNLLTNKSKLATINRNMLPISCTILNSIGLIKLASNNPTTPELIPVPTLKK